MQNETRVLFNRLLERQAVLNGVDSGAVREGKAFVVAPSIQQTLEAKQQESSAFLGLINVVGVDEMEGEKLGLGVTSPLAGRTNTTANDRLTKDPSVMDQRGYKVAQTNSDTHLTYAKLDMWAKFPNFQVLFSENIINQQALDRIMIGFNGTSVAAATNLVANPLLQDVNKGWLQYLREVAPTHVLDEGATANQVRVGSAAGHDYRNLDSLVMDACHNLLPSWARNNTDLVAIVGADLLHDKYFPMVDIDQPATEKIATDVLLSKRQIGGKPAATVPFVPANSILITPFKNLSIYYQNGKRRRTIVDNAKRDRIETYESSNDAYVIENTDAAVLIENIKLSWPA